MANYAKVRAENGRYVISKGADTRKDQSYVLWGVSQACLSRTLFPVGHMEKPAIKQMARDMGYLDLANKAESYEICFVPDNDYRGFLRRNVEGLDKPMPGNFVDVKGNVLGQHQGYPFYTVGQRKGLGIANGQALFVTEILPDTNTVVLGELHDLDGSSMMVGKLNISKYSSISEPMNAITKVRYKHNGESSVLNPVNDQLRIDFMNPVAAIAPGQSAVFYEGDDLVGGGIILKKLK